MASSLRDIEELAGYTQENPMPAGADIITQQEAVDALNQRAESARVAGTVTPFESSFNPTNPNFRQTIKSSLNNLFGGSNISSNPNYLQGRIANTLSGLVDFAPVVGDAVGVGDTITSYRQGDMLGTGINALATGVGVLPLVGGPASKAVKAGGNRVRSALRGIDAWHGSPYEFENFSMDKMGTGEGAQAYGHGLYFAENSDVAGQYKHDLTINQQYNSSGVNDKNYARALDSNLSAGEFDTFEVIARKQGAQGTPESLADEFFDIHSEWQPLKDNPSEYENIRKFAEDYQGNLPQGSLYNVNLNVNPEDLLDLDATLSQQPKKVQDMWQKFAKSRKGKASAKENEIEDIRNLVPRYGNEITGEDIRQAIYSGQPANFNHNYSSNIAPQENKMTSEYLQRQGIKGIRYLDGASRSLPDFYISSPDTTVSGKWMVKDIGNPNSQGSHFDTEMAAKSYLDEIQSKPTRNYVMFDDSLIDTKRVNDQLTPSWMEQSARMQRAQDLGFEEDIYYKGMYPYDYIKESGDYRGPEITEINRPSEFPAFNKGEEGVDIAGFLTKDREVANRFAGSSGSGAVYPLRYRKGEVYTIDANGRNAGELQFGESGKEFRDAVRSGNYDTIEILNTADEGDITIATQPKNIRSTNAEFDPTKADSADLLSSISPTQSSLRNIA